MNPLVFEPEIGFRPLGTRVLRERVETTTDGTKLRVLAVTAAPDGTDVVIEWERRGDPAECPPDSKLLVHHNRAPLENGLAAGLVAGATRLDATAMWRRAYHYGASISAIDAITFPALPADADAVELSVREGARTWRAPLALLDGEVNAAALTAQVARESVVVRATAVSRYEGELFVELEVESRHQIRQVGQPIPTALRFSDTNDEGHRARQAEMRRVFGDASRPITLEDGGHRVEETRRLFSHEPQRNKPGEPFISRFVVVFDPTSGDAGTATLVVPFVELNDAEHSATADLRNAPVDVAQGEHRFKIVRAESRDTEQRVFMEIAPTASGPRFTQPQRMSASDPEKFAWQGTQEADGLVSMAASAGDPPIVTFRGAVLRVDGPFALALTVSS